MAGVRVDVGLRTGKFTAGLDEMRQKAEAFKGKMQAVGAFVGAAIAGAGIASIGEHVSHIKDLSDQLGMSAESVQRLGYAFAQGGATQEDFVKGQTKLTQKMQEAREGNEEALKSFARVGITLEEVQRLTPDEMMVRFADALAEADDPALQLAAAMDLLGKSGRSLVPTLKEGGDALKAYMRDARALTDDQVQAIEAMAQKTENFFAKSKTNILAGVARNVMMSDDKALQFGGAIVGAGEGAIDSLFGTKLTVPTADFDTRGRQKAYDAAARGELNDQPPMPGKEYFAAQEAAKKVEQQLAEERRKAKEEEFHREDAANEKMERSARALRFLQMSDLEKLKALYGELREAQLQLGKDDGSAAYAERRASVVEKLLEYSRELKGYNEDQAREAAKGGTEEDPKVPQLKLPHSVVSSLQAAGGGGRAYLYGDDNRQMVHWLRRIADNTAGVHERKKEPQAPAQKPAFQVRR